jgi:F-type H+-transporting ATPase subunit gamma
VSAAKFARANQAVKAARPSAEAFEDMMEKLLRTLSASKSFESRLLHEEPEERVLLVILAPDRGMCGGLNSNMFRMITRWLDERLSRQVSVDVWAFGNRGIQFMKKRQEKVLKSATSVYEKTSYAAARKMAAEMIETFGEGNFNHVYVAFPEFRSALQQIPTVKQVLPIVLPKVREAGEVEHPDYIVEPELEVFLKRFLERHVAGQVFRMYLEARASEHGARMTAMDGATVNAGEVIKALTLEYNRARQASITKELIEIVSGAEAL